MIPNRFVLLCNDCMERILISYINVLYDQYCTAGKAYIYHYTFTINISWWWLHDRYNWVIIATRFICPCDSDHMFDMSRGIITTWRTKCQCDNYMDDKIYNGYSLMSLCNIGYTLMSLCNSGYYCLIMATLCAWICVLSVILCWQSFGLLWVEMVSYYYKNWS